MKKELKTELTKKKILKAALEAFGSMGYASTSINLICSAGISKGLLYHNFENKDALYLACVGQFFGELEACLRGHAPFSDFHSYMDARLHFFQHRPYMAGLFIEAVLQPPLHLESKVKALQENFNLLNREIFQQMLASVTLREGVTETDAMEYFWMMQTMFNGSFRSNAWHSKDFLNIVASHETNLSKLLDFMLYGIAERRQAE